MRVTTKRKRRRITERQIYRAFENVLTIIFIIGTVWVLASVCELAILRNSDDCSKLNILCYLNSQLEEQWEQEQENIRNIYGW